MSSSFRNTQANALMMMVGAALLSAVAGCATDTADAADSESTTSIGTTREAISYPGGGLAYLGNAQMKSAVGNYCVQSNSGSAVTAPCANVASQIGAVYQTPNGKYNLCYPNTLKIEHVKTSTGEYDQASATCLNKFSLSSKSINFSKVILSVKGWDNGSDFWAPFNSRGAWISDWDNCGWFGQEAGGVYTWRYSGLKLTRDSNNGNVVLWSALGNTSQSWSFIWK